MNFNQTINLVSNGESLILRIDETNSSFSFGYTDSIEKIHFNICQLGNRINPEEYQRILMASNDGLTTLFPIGRYIVILRVKKDRSSSEMLFLDFRISLSDIKNTLSGTFSEWAVHNIQRIKLKMDKHFEQSIESVSLQY